MKMKIPSSNERTDASIYIEYLRMLRRRATDEDDNPFRPGGTLSKEAEELLRSLSIRRDHVELCPVPDYDSAPPPPSNLDSSTFNNNTITNGNSISSKTTRPHQHSVHFSPYHSYLEEGDMKELNEGMKTDYSNGFKSDATVPIVVDTTSSSKLLILHQEEDQKGLLEPVEGVVRVELVQDTHKGELIAESINLKKRKCCLLL